MNTKAATTILILACLLAFAGSAAAASEFTSSITITGNTTIVLGQSTTLTADWTTNKDVTRCEWSVGGVGEGEVVIDPGAQAGSSPFTFTPAAAGTYTICFEIWHHSDPRGSGYGVSNRYDQECVTITVVDECTLRTETAFGGDIGVNVGSPGAWFYHFDTSGDEEQSIWAGQYEEIGTVIYDGSNITIVLTGGWELQDVTEPVKIQGYNNAPDSRPAAGLFTTYKGDELEVPVDPFNYFVIQLDVQICE